MDLRELAVKVLNQSKTGGIVLEDLHELLVQYGKYKTNSPRVDQAADNIINHFIKEPTTWKEQEEKELVDELVTKGLQMIKEELGINTIKTKEGKEIYV
jgi:hypothetical protein